MEKNIHTHLFTSALSQREQRLLFMAGEQLSESEFRSKAEALQKQMENPDVNTAAVEADLRVLALSAALNPGRKAKIDEIVQDLRPRVDADKTLEDIKSKTASSNPEWMFMKSSIAPRSARPNSYKEGVEAAKVFIKETLLKRNALNALRNSPDKPYNVDQQMAAYNANISAARNLTGELNRYTGDEPRAQSSAPPINITFIPTLDTATPSPRSVPAATPIPEPETITIKADPAPMPVAAPAPDVPVAAPANPKDTNSFIGRGVDALKNAVTSIPALAAGIANKGNEALKFVQSGLTDKQKDDFAQDLNKELEKQGSTKRVEKNKDGNLELKDAAPADASKGPAATPEKLSDADQKQVDELKNAILNKDEAASKKVREEISKAPKEKKFAMVKAVNDALRADKYEKGHAVVDMDGAVKIALGPETAAAEPPKEVKKGLDKLIELFERFLELFRGERIANGDIGLMQSRLSEIEPKIRQLRRDPNFGTNKNLQKQVTDLEVEQKELELKIADTKKVTSDVLRDAKGIVQGTPGSVIIVGQDGKGVYFRAAPGAPRDAAQAQMDYLVGRIEKRYQNKAKVVQSSRLRQDLHVNINGPVYINSFNETDNSRNIKVSGKNNSVNVQGSQNGNNDQNLRGGVSADAAAFQATEGLAKNVTPPRRRGRVVQDQPKTGDLS